MQTQITNTETMENQKTKVSMTINSTECSMLLTADELKVWNRRNDIGKFELMTLSDFGILITNTENKMQTSNTIINNETFQNIVLTKCYEHGKIKVLNVNALSDGIYSVQLKNNRYKPEWFIINTNNNTAELV